jgi:pimeloyl-ACP methyl ester carboxylesterase
MRVRALALLCAALAGCSSGASVPQPPAPNVETASMLVPASAGATVGLPSGSKVVIPAAALPTDQNLTLSRDANDLPNVRTQGWKSVPGSMTLSLGAVLPATPSGTTPPSLSFTMPYPSAQASTVLAARAPVLELIGPSGTLGRLSAAPVFDTARGMVTMTISRGALDGASSLKFYLAAGDGTIAAVPFGPRYWNATASPPAWQAQAISLNASARTVVMVHGVFSNVESAFPCEQSIVGAGNYGQAVGIDYDWTQPPATGAAQLAAFINSLPVSTVDIWAHSYGTVVTLAALPAITKKLGHVALLGGPLPLNGAPQADAGFWLDLILAGAFIASPEQVWAAYDSGMIAGLATNSAVMQQVNSGVRALTLPPFVQVAGGSPLPQESDVGVHFLYLLLYGGTTNDGVVEQQSALTQFSPTTSSITMLSLDHVQLECDPGAIGFVGPLVNH